MVGPVDNKIVCLAERYSKKRLVPPFSNSLTEIDWRDWDVVSPVADQGTCGSCYAFSTIAAAESAYAIKTGDLYRGSEQHIVACNTRNFGCDGGQQIWASEFLVANGVILNSDYPYVGELNLECEQANYQRIFYLTSPGWRRVDQSKTAFKAALRIEPINISFDVQYEFNYYASGVYEGEGCSDSLNHAM